MPNARRIYERSSNLPCHSGAHTVDVLYHFPDIMGNNYLLHIVMAAVAIRRHWLPKREGTTKWEDRRGYRRHHNMQHL